MLQKRKTDDRKLIISFDGNEFTRIPGHREYVVNREGTIVKRIESASLIRRPQLALQNRPDGYQYAVLLSKDVTTKDGRICDQSCFSPIGVHRLVALTYVDNPNPTTNIWVNHKDGNKANNHYLNLEWTTIKENIRHAHDTGLANANHIKGWMKGLKHTEEAKRLMSTMKTGIFHPKFAGWYVIDGLKFASSIEAARALGTYPRKILVMCKKKPSSRAYFEPKPDYL